MFYFHFLIHDHFLQTTQYTKVFIFVYCQVCSPFSSLPTLFFWIWKIWEIRTIWINFQQWNRFCCWKLIQCFINLSKPEFTRILELSFVSRNPEPRNYFLFGAQNDFERTAMYFSHPTTFFVCDELFWSIFPQELISEFLTRVHYCHVIKALNSSVIL